jgi:cellulose synthase/poly-beta-1,6-N-acetylglucosamine synthase-like glycosyltransferase
MLAAKLLFWLSVFMVIYIYLGYPLLITLLAALKKSRIRKTNLEPTVSIIISAYNEEDHIEKTIENKLLQDYPKEKLEIIVVSDGSSDGTDEIVQRYSDQGVRLVRQEPRSGKTAAINRAVLLSTGEIVAFSDANSIWERYVIAKLVRNFSDPSVGYVTGRMVYTDPDGTVVGDGCSAYMKYENFLRVQESRVGSVVGVDGGVDAVRRTLYRAMSPDQLPDFVLPLRVVEQGYRVVYEPEAILKESALKSSGDEYRMRVRVSLRAFWALWDLRVLLDFRNWGLFAWQLWSHKVLRYLCFVFLAGAYLGNYLLWGIHPVYKAFFIVQNSCYIAAAFSPHLESRGYECTLLRFVHYFALLQAATAHAFVRFALGQKQVLWTPRKG